MIINNVFVKIIKYWQALLFLAVFAFLSILTLHEYDRYPYEGHLEEQSFAWAGFSLFKENRPVSWSHFDYPRENKIFTGALGEEGGIILNVTLIDPWFDHPPLFALLSGLGPYLAGFEKISVFPTHLIRIPSVIAVVLTYLAVFFLAKSIFGYWTGIFSTLYFGLTPIFVFGGRLAVPEVLISLLFVLMMICWVKFKKDSRNMWVILIGLLTGVSGLMKITGFSLTFLFVFFLIKDKKYKLALFLLVIEIVFIFLLYLYGASLDLNLFIQIVQRQGFRPVGWSTLTYIFSSPGFDIFNYFDGWFVFALISSVIVAFNNKRKDEENYLLWGVFYWLAVVIFTGGQQDMLPWYRYPMYPFLAITAVRVLQLIYKNPSFFSYLLVTGMLLSSRFYLRNAFRPDILPGTFRYMFVFLMFPILIFEAKIIKKDLILKIVRIFLVLVILWGAYYNAKLIYSVYSINCENLFPACYLGPGNKLSRIHLPIFWRFLVNYPLKQ